MERVRAQKGAVFSGAEEEEKRKNQEARVFFVLGESAQG
jgi:hypothetical protein